jgi:imidazolonepropionase-like amidohydrolase
MGDMVGELELYVRHGMAPLDALASATTVTAELLRLPDVGLVEPGYVADLLVLGDDPLASVGALRDPQVVVARGAVVSG